MRSRDGNNYRLFAIFSVIFFYSLALNAGEYLISYRYVVKDMKLFNESFQISRAMTKCTGLVQNSIELAYKDTKNLLEVISQNNESFIDFIHKIGLGLEYKSLTINAQYSSTTIITLKTRCFKVDFNDYFVKISSLK